MRRIILRLVLGVALFAIEIGTTQAEEAYLKLDGFPGDSTRAGYVGWTESLGWSLGLGLSPSGGPAGARPFVFYKKTDRSSPKLAAAAATGTRIKNAVLDVLKLSSNEGPSVFYRIILHEVTLRQYSVTGSPPTSGATYPTEQIELGYSKIEWYYFTPGPNGTVILQSQAKLDVATNTLYP